MDVGATQATDTETASAHKAARTALIAFLLLATVIWIGIAIGANVRTPGIVGLAASVIGGLCAAVLTAAIGGWIALKLAHADRSPPPPPQLADTDPLIAPAIAETLAAQELIRWRMVEAAAWRIPVGAAIAIALWSAAVLIGAPGSFLDFSATLLAGGLIGYLLARHAAARDLAAAYAQRGLDTLARMNGLAWRRATTLDAQGMIRRGLLSGQVEIVAGGDVSGQHGDVTLHIAPVAGKRAPTNFEGLLIEFTAPGLGAASMETIAQSRPAAIALIDQLATLPGLGKPLCAADGDRLWLAVPETLKPRVFAASTDSSAAALAARFTRARQVILAVQQIATALAPADRQGN